MRKWSPCLPLSGQSRRFRLDLKKRTVSALNSKVPSSSPWSGKSRPLRLGLKSRAVFPWSGKSRCLCLGGEKLILGRAVSALVWKVVPSPPWSKKSRPLRPDLKNCAVSPLVWKVALSPPWSRGIDTRSRRLLLGLENCANSISVWKVWKWLSVVAPFPEPQAQGRAASTLVAKVAPEFFCRKSPEMANLGHGKSRNTKYELRCFGRATSASLAKVATDHHGRESL